MSDEIGSGRGALPIACSLSESGLAERRRELVESVFSGVLRTDELEDGYAFVFPGSEGWATRLVDTIVAERACCPFLGFELVFEPGGGRILLRVRGPEGAKELVAELAALRSG